MLNVSKIRLTAAIAVLSACVSGQAQATTFEIAIDPGFEDAGANGFVIDPVPGTVLAPGWQGFTNGNVVTATPTDPNSGSFAASLETINLASSAVLKNANIGIGVVAPNSPVEVSFWARGDAENGGVAFAEFFSELSGGGTSSTEILGGAPLALNSDPAVWTLFQFSTTTGADVSGGVTLQFVASAGGVNGSASVLQIDDISVRVDPIDVPAPASLMLLLTGLGGLGLLRKKAPAAAIAA